MNFSKHSNSIWGKLTSLKPQIRNIDLETDCCSFQIHSRKGFRIPKTHSSKYQCQIYLKNGAYFLKKACTSAILIEDREMEDNEVSELCSGERISIKLGQQEEDPIEYIFSSQLNQQEKSDFKRAREE